MTFRVDLPPRFDTFVQKVRAHAPAFPIAPARPAEEERENAKRQLGIIGALLDGMEQELPDPLARSLNAMLADSPEDFVAGEIEDALVARAGGAPVAGVQMLLEGAYQELTRVDAMITYLLSTEGYVSTLARAAALALTLPGPPRLPAVIVAPGRARLQGRLRGRYRTAYVAGRDRVRTVFDILDRMPVIEGEAHPTTRCLIALMDEAGYLAIRDDMMWRAVRAASDVIEEKILRIDLSAQRRELMRWCSEA